MPRFAFAVGAAAFILLTSLAGAEPLSAPFTVPVTVVDGYVFVDVRLNGQGPFRFMFDTGADLVVVDPIAQKMALNVRDWGDGIGDGEGNVHWRRSEIDDVALGNLHLTHHAIGVLPTDDVRAEFGTYPVVGFIGRPLLEGTVVKLDYVHRQLTFTPADKFSYSGTGTVLPLLRGHVTATIDNVEQQFFIDTGTRPGLTLGTATSAEFGLTSKYKVTSPGITDWGAGGGVHTQVTRAQSLKLGDIEVHDPLVYLSLQRAGMLASQGGWIGSGFLSQFDVTFDTSRARLILEKNAAFGRPETYDRIGLRMNQGEPYFTVVDVIAGGPADAAGVRVGDTILAIDGADTANLVLPAVREQLEQRSANDHVNLLLRSGDKRREVTVRLRERV